MTINSSWFISASLAFALAPVTVLASGTPTPPPTETSGWYNDHFYEVVPFPAGTRKEDKEWDDARLLAESRTFTSDSGVEVQGHLATITSEGEDAFVEGLRALANLAPKEAWVGGFTMTACPDPAAAGCGWMWINDEGAISTPAEPQLSYSNWQGGEPNNLGGAEYHLGIGHTGEFGWNDEGQLGNIGGFVVEYDVPVTVPVGSSGVPIPLAVGATATFPDSVVLADGAQIDLRRVEFTDDLSACGTMQREIFMPGNTSGTPDAIIPAYLCGSPRFLVVSADSTGIELPSGTVLVENQTSDVFPDNLFDCTGPYDPLLNSLDPQNRDVMAWQTSDPAQMPENDLGAMHGYPGSVGEFTFECGSSRGKGNFGSLYFVGLHIDFGPDFDDYASNAEGVHTQFALLTRYKLHVLQDVILESEVALDSSWGQRLGFFALRGLVNSAIYWHDRGAYDRALRRLELIDLTLQYLPYTVIPGENYQGATEMRTSNSIFMYTDKVLSSTP